MINDTRILSIYLAFVLTYPFPVQAVFEKKKNKLLARGSIEQRLLSYYSKHSKYLIIIRSQNR